MHLYIANTTKQHHHFQFRLPEQSPRLPLIKAGQQICLDNLSNEEIGIVLKQNDIYGIQDAKEISRRKVRYIGICYSIGEPVNIDQMLTTYEANDEALKRRANERIVEQAAAVQEVTAEHLHRTYGVDKDAARPAIESTVIEETQDGGSPAVARGVEVGKTPDFAPRRARR